MDKNIHTVKEIPESLKNILSSAEAFEGAMRYPMRREFIQSWIDKDKKSQRGENSDVESITSASKRNREVGTPPGTYAKAAPGMNPRMETIAEVEGKKRRIENTRGRDVAHHEDKLTKIQLHIEQAEQKADKTLISEVPANGWIKRYEEAKSEEGTEGKAEEHKAKGKGKATAKETKALKQAWRSCILDWAEQVTAKVKPTQ